jgi:glycosyltransferase 2 family protein
MFYAKLALGLAAFAAAIYFLDWRQALHVAEQLSVAGVLVVLLLILVEFPLLAWRWHLIVGRAGAMPARRHIEMYFIASFLGMFTPGLLGGDAYRLVLLRRQGVRTRLGLTLLLRERLLGVSSHLLFLAAAAGIALSTEGTIPGDGRGFLLLCGALAAAGIVALFSGRYLIYLLRRLSLGRVHRYIHDGLKLVHGAFQFRSAGEAAWLLAISLMSAATWVLAYDVVARLIGIEIGFFLLAAIVVVVELIRLVPVTVQGLGVREVTFATIFTMIGQDAAAGFVICAMCYLLLNVATLIGGLTGYGLAFADHGATAEPATQVKSDNGTTP